MSSATAFLVLALSLGMIVTHACMARPGMALWSVVADFVAWLVCYIIQRAGAAPEEDAK